MDNNVRVRFAPSPTGYLHVGGARTALYNWLYAKATGGTFVLRIEDTDQARSTEKALQEQISDLKWLGLNWDEGPEVGGPYGPYKQSQRLSIYREYADKLLTSGKAYYCFCTDAELEAKKEAAMKAGTQPHYDGKCRSVTLDQAKARLANGEKGAARFHIKNKKDYVLPDLIRGDVNFPSDMVGDFVILRSDGMPVYNFCVVIDDALMKITHVLRAEEHLSNTVRQLMLYEAYGFTPPWFGHLSLILDTDRKKLSKRMGATSVHDFNKRGFLPEAMINFLVLLGWSSPKGQEVMSLKELIEQFGLDRFNPAGAIFDDKKLLWMNSVHLRALPNEELWKRLEPLLKEAGFTFAYDREWIDRALDAYKPQIETLEQAVPLFKLLSDKDFSLTPEGAELAKVSRAVIESWIGELQSKPASYLTEDEFNQMQDQVKIKCNVNGKNLFQPIRVAVVGQPQGVEVKKLVPLLKRESLIFRAQKSIGAVT
ncbi:MAG: glutamate--tRNA ligase [Bdellovibrionia bacterium]